MTSDAPPVDPADDPVGDQAGGPADGPAVGPAEPSGSSATTSTTLTVEREPRPKRPHIPVWQESIILAVIAVVLAIVIKAFFVQAFFIPSESMQPGLVKNDRILVQKVSYWGGGQPQRGDVVVFKDPGGWLSQEEDAGPTNGFTKVLAKVGLFPSGGHLVKRVVGVAGDVIKCCNANGELSVNGVDIDEKGFVQQDQDLRCDGPMTGDCNWTAGPVPAGHVFVMGDNRDHSADSTVHMCVAGETDCVPGHEYVPDDLIVGKVFALVWPLSHLGGVGGTSAFDKVPNAKD